MLPHLVFALLLSTVVFGICVEAPGHFEVQDLSELEIEDPWNFVIEEPTNADITAAVKGIDVSRWQGDVNWKTVVDRGILFAYIKATEGTSTAVVDGITVPSADFFFV